MEWLTSVTVSVLGILFTLLTIVLAMAVLSLSGAGGGTTLEANVHPAPGGEPQADQAPTQTSASQGPASPPPATPPAAPAS